MGKPPKTILALAPGTRHLGVAVLAGHELVYFGVKSFPGKKSTQTFLLQVAASLTRVIRRYRPDILAIEETYYAQARSSLLLSVLISSLRILGRKHHLRNERILPTEVKRYFCTGKPTRRRLADAMCLRYSFLATFLRQHRTPGYWQQMFDAVGLGAFVACQSPQRESIESKPSSSHPQQLNA
jgi:Holliday junction resolvasome RuvABC endonuclease subunit